MTTSLSRLPQETPRDSLLDLLDEVPAVTRRFQRGQELLTGPSTDAGLSVIRDGWACRARIGSGNQRHILEFILPGDIVSIGSLIGIDPGYVAPTLTTVDVVSIDGASLIAAAKTDWRLNEALLASAVRSTASSYDAIAIRAKRGSIERVATLLYGLALRLRSRGLSHGDIFPLPITQYDIGDATGVTSIHVNRTLRSLRASDVLVIKQRALHILSWARLRMIVGVLPVDGHSALGARS